MWSKRVCVMLCACALLTAAVAAIGLPCKQPPCIPDNVLSDADQFLVKGVLFKNNISDLESHYGNLVGILFLFTKDAQEQDFKTPKSSPFHPVEVVEEVLEWVPATKLTAVSLKARAFVAGREGWDGSPLWVIRANYSGELVPGKLAIKHLAAYIPYGGKEVPVDDFEVLCAPQHSLHWKLASEPRQVLDSPIVAGNTGDGEPLYTARCSHEGSATPGKFDPRKLHAHISFNKKEIICSSFELLSWSKTFTASASPYLEYENVEHL